MAGCDIIQLYSGFLDPSGNNLDPDPTVEKKNQSRFQIQPGSGYVLKKHRNTLLSRSNRLTP